MKKNKSSRSKTISLTRALLYFVASDWLDLDDNIAIRLNSLYLQRINAKVTSFLFLLELFDVRFAITMHNSADSVII